jgi:hypothetical protein
MKRSLKIFALILIYFLACGKSCDNEEKNDTRREQVRVIAETDSLRSAFGTDTLSAASLLAYVETAKQKFYDYNDYLRIVADTTAAAPFRDKARNMILSLFIAGTEPAKMTTPYGLESVETKEAFQRINDSVYSGSLSFSFETLKHRGKNTGFSPEKCTVTVFLVKHDKNFGKGKLMLWDVFLGKIE